MRRLRLLALGLSLCLLAGCSGPSSITILDPGVSVDTPYIDVGQAPTEYPVEYIPPEDMGSYIAPAPANPADAPLVVYSDPGDGFAPADASQSSGGIQTDSLNPIDLKIGLVVGEQAVLHPLHTPYVDFLNINSLVFESLVDLDENLKPVPLLADRWEVSGNEWTFTLRSGVQFHDTSLLSAADVVASYNNALQYTETVWYPLLQSIETMEEVDESTVLVRAKSNMGYLVLYAMTFPILQRSSIGYAQPMGTGPYWYMGYNTSQSLLLSSNPFWWKRPNDEVRTIFCLCYSESQEAMAALESGEIDALATHSNVAALSRSLNDRVSFDYTTTRYECILPNLNDTILQSKAVREALMYGIDRTSLGSTAYMGMVQESEVPVVPGSYLYEAQATKFNYSPERAYQLLLDDGWQDVNNDGILEKEINGIMADLSLTLITYAEGNSPVRAESARAIAEQLRKIGVSVDVQVTTRGSVSSNLSDGEFQLALVSYNLSQMPHLGFLFASAGNGNFVGYSSETMDNNLMSAFTAQSEAELIAAMSRVQMQITQDLPMFGLFFRTGVVVSKKGLYNLSGIREGQAFKGLEMAQFE